MRPFHQKSLGRKICGGAIKSWPGWAREGFHYRFSTVNNLELVRERRAKMADQGNYNNWTRVGLIQRVKELEKELRAASSSSSAQISTSNNEISQAVSEEQQQRQQQQQQAGDGDGELSPLVTKPKGKRKIDPSKYSTRFIALKLAYLGKNFGGFEFQAQGNQSSIEEELWNALTKACLIFPEDKRVVDFDCCEYSKCGRTDRGVSAFGQVIALRVRSNRPLPKKQPETDDGVQLVKEEEHEAAAEDQAKKQSKPKAPPRPFDDIRDEIPYSHVLNRLLPKEIRIQAWCPAPPPGFSARFSCRERQYRYFFTQPAFAPTPSPIEDSAAAKEGVKGKKEEDKKPMKPGWLDIEAMRDAAKRYEGEHDFRNLCKIDPAKQITKFKRRMFESDIVEVKDAASALLYLRAAGFAPENIDLSSGEAYPKVYYFHVRGSAFLWHQIRHMVAVLFLVGQGLEKPSLISELLDVEKNPRRPNYVMADEVPLVLWDCIFPSDLNDTIAPRRKDDALKWIYVGEDGPSGRYGQFGIMDDAWQLWRGRKMDEILAGQLLQHISQQGNNGTTAAALGKAARGIANSTKVFEGGNNGRLSGKYPGVLNMKLLESVDEQNDKYAKRNGYADGADMRAKKGMKSNKTEEGDAVMANE